MGALEGKIAVVTGASSGSGLGIARRFVEEDATVLLWRVVATASSGRRPTWAPSHSLRHRRRRPGKRRPHFQRGWRSLRRVDILVNNAAVYRPCRVELLSDLDIEQQMRTNFAGPVYTCRAAIPLLRVAGAGDIVNTSSKSTLHPFPMLSMFSATKAALEAFALVLAQEVRDDDIRVTTVIQGRANGSGNGSTDWEWDPEHRRGGDRSVDEVGLISQALGRKGGQEVQAIGDVHVFVRDSAPNPEDGHRLLPQLLSLSIDAVTGRSRAPRAHVSYRRPAPVPSPRPGARRGCATARARGAGRVGPVRAALTADIDTSRSQRPPEAIACRQASAAVRPVTGSARASAQNSGASSFQTTRPPAAAASSPNATRLAASSERP